MRRFVPLVEGFPTSHLATSDSVDVAAPMCPATDSFGLHHNPKLHLTEPKLCTAFYCCSQELTASQAHLSLSIWASWRPFPCIANRTNKYAPYYSLSSLFWVYLLPHLFPKVASRILISSILNTKGESWTIKKAECQRIDAFEVWCWRRLLRVPWTARRSNQSILKEINPEYSLEGLMLKLKLQYFGHLMQRANSLEKTLMLDARKTEVRRRREWQRMRWLDGYEFEQTQGDSEGQGSLACCSS